MFPKRVIFAPLVIVAGLALAPVADAQEAATAPDAGRLTGLWLNTAYPEISEEIGDTLHLSLGLQNRNLPPQRVALSVSGLPGGWTWQIEGDGRPVAAAIVRPDQDVSLTLDLTPPKDAKPGRYAFRVAGAADGQTLDLPITLTLTEAKQAKATLEPKLPALRGTPRSTFDFELSAKNDSAEDLVFNLVAQAPAGFQAVFKEQYGSQELTSIPIKAGETKTLKLSVTPPPNVAAGQYPVAVGVASPAATAEARLMLDITGQPSLALGGPEGRLSGEATAGKERTFNFTLTNSGTAPAQNVKLAASAPSEWKVTFNPETVDQVAPGQEVPVGVSMTPSDKAIAGDYVVTVRANGDGASDSANFRVTVLTSTMWGVAGLGVIGAAAIVLAVAVTRYGRR
jgi:uncharacterized repeat protein (TIGR01451 family)